MNQTTKGLVRGVLKSLGIHRQTVMLTDNLFPNRILTDRKKTLQFYSPFIQRGDLCFDVGANEGFKTKSFLMLGAKVVAIEPQGVCLHRLHSGVSAERIITADSVHML